MKKTLIAYLKKYLYEFLIKRIFGAAIGGIKGFLVEKLYNYGWKKVVLPKILMVFRKVKTAYKRVVYRKQAKELIDAETKDEFESGADNMP